MADHIKQVLPDPGALALRASELFVIAASSAISVRGSFSVALSGGSTPGLFFSTLAKEPYCGGVEWEKVHVFFADERCVEPSDGMSNYKLAYDSLLSRVPAHIHRIEGELGPDEAARKYSEVIKDILGATPVLDMVFLGMGEDGHTASLFPGSALLNDNDSTAVSVVDREPQRVSMTLTLINSARTIVFLVTGLQKASVLSEILDKGNPRLLPAGLVSHGALWLLDEKSASGLKG